MCPAALHDEQRMVLLARLRIVPDCGFPVLSAFHESPELLSAEHYPQAGFPAAPYKDYPTQTFFLRGISLLVGHKRDGLAPAVWLSMRSAAVSVLSGCVHRSCADAVYFLPVLQMVLPQSPLRFAGHRCVGPVPAVWGLVCSAAALVLTGCQHRPCAGVVYSLSMARTAQHDTQAVALA